VFARNVSIRGLFLKEGISELLLVCLKFIERIGTAFLCSLYYLGDVSIFFGRVVFMGIRPPYYWRQILRQAVQIGYFSLPVVGLTAVFSGMATALQCYGGLPSFSAQTMVPSVVALAIVRELGPVLTALMIAGRLGGAMAAEIGTMRVTEQIDALSTLSVYCEKYLFFPRIFVGLVLLPALILVDDVLGILGGYLVCVYSFDFNSTGYLVNTFKSLNVFDIFVGMLKGSCFGLIICLMGCYNGYRSGRGAEGVGRSTTNSVVYSSVLVLLFNYILSFALF
jgi:phospholipid/cholesterol/gamma-HCH transport system permease protein